jgi:hypothetical protein
MDSVPAGPPDSALGALLRLPAPGIHSHDPRHAGNILSADAGKIRPPLSFRPEHADQLLAALSDVLTFTDPAG